MQKKWVSFSLAFLISTAGMLGFLTLRSDEVRGSVLYVGGGGFGNFTTIQDAVTAAADGDTIYVYNGTYYENVIIDKCVTLIGEDRNTTIIDGMGVGNTVYIQADWVNITGFTVNNSGSNPGDGGIKLNNADYCRIWNNNASSNNLYGISLDLSDWNNILGNNVSRNVIGISLFSSIKNNITYNTAFKNSDFGIVLGYSSENNVSHNHAHLSHSAGIELSSSLGNKIIGNNCSLNTADGIHLYLSPLNELRDNNASYNNNGIELYSSELNTLADNLLFHNSNHGILLFESEEDTLAGNVMIEDGIFIEGTELKYWNTHHIDTSNTINGKPMYYWKNQTGGVIPLDAGEVILANCTNVLVENLTLVNGTVGVELGYSSDNEVRYNNATSNNRVGIFLDVSNQNNITENEVYYNGWEGGINLQDSLRNTIKGNNVSDNSWGFTLVDSHLNTIEGNNIFDNSEIGIAIDKSNGNIITDNNITSNGLTGVYLWDSNVHTITGNNITSNGWSGIYLGTSDGHTVTGNSIKDNDDGVTVYQTSTSFFKDNTITSNVNNGFDLEAASGHTFDNCTIDSNPTAVHFDGQSMANTFVNCSISNSGTYDFHFDNASGGDSFAVSLNTTFDKSKVRYEDTLSYLIVEWFMHVNVIYYNRTPVSNAEFWVNDTHGTTIINDQTDAKGWKKWNIVTEYIEQDVNGDKIGDRTYYTPHHVTATDQILWGEAHPDPIMNKSKTVTVILGNYTSIYLYPGWNLISLPRTQTYPALKTVLNSIEGDYDAVQYFNFTDNKDHWKHHHISKPQHLNDLKEIKHPMGFWIHVTNPNGTTLLVYGDIFSSPENIPLYKGWNQVGYPSLSNKTTIAALNNLFYGVEVDSIWTFDAPTQTWEEVSPGGDFEICRGYWIHATQDCVWEVPL